MLIDTSHLRTGAIIGYHLPPSEQPSDPNRIWKGRVISWHGNMLLIVEMLEPGYQGLREYVNVNQVVAVSRE